MNSLKSRAMNCGPLSEMTRGSRHAYHPPRPGPEAKALAMGRRSQRPASSIQSLRRALRGLDPVHRLKARENAAGSENPTK
jgi:hypothetical protein